MPRGRRTRLTSVRMPGATPLTTNDREVLEKILAALVARAFASDHPELFGDCDTVCNGVMRLDD